jgi:type IV pilus assembly protein PilN
MLIAVNLASRPFADLRPILRRMRIAMSVLIMAAIVLGLVLRAVNRRAHEADARIQSLDREIANTLREQQGFVALMARPEDSRIKFETENLNQLFAQKAFSWTLVMEDLETVLPAGVKVTEIEPILAKDGHITLHLRVQGPRDKGIELVQNMEHSRCFLSPRIVAESTDAPAGPNQKQEPVSSSTLTDFDLLAEYNTDSGDESTPVGHVVDSAQPSASLQAPPGPPFVQHHSPDLRIASPNAQHPPLVGVLQ